MTKVKLLTAKQIKRERLARDMTQKALGEQVGQKPSYISFIEGGFRPEKDDVLKRITEILTQPIPPEVAKRVAEKKAAKKAREVAERRRAKKRAEKAAA